jgi:hypothetical protein
MHGSAMITGGVLSEAWSRLEGHGVPAHAAAGWPPLPRSESGASPGALVVVGDTGIEPVTSSV